MTTLTLSPAQCRAARGLLGWSQLELAKAAQVGLSSVRDLETERREVSPAIMSRLREALENAGVDILENGNGPGVRLSRRKVAAPVRAAGVPDDADF